MQKTVKFTFQTVKVRFSMIAVALLVLIAALLGGCKKSNTGQQPPPPPGMSDTLRFVFMADSRGDTLQHPVNTEVLNAIIGQIAALKPKPSFVMFAGDMAYRGWIDSAYTFQAWKELFAPLTDNGIVLYTAIGNHELYHQHSSYGFLLVNQVQFQNDFSENPVNGPAGYEHLTYSFTDTVTSSFFAVLDPYFINKDTVHMDLGGNIDSTQMEWLKEQVAQTNALHKFLFIHTPYYYVSDDPEEPSAANETYTALWAFLDANKFDFYACGHSHLYSRKTIDSSIPPNPQTTPPTPSWQNNVVQLLNRTCGAGPSTGPIDPDIKTAWNVHNDAHTYYFSVVDVSGNTVIVNSYQGYTGAYTVFDTFTITK
jgi:hypothetical protein